VNADPSPPDPRRESSEPAYEGPDPERPAASAPTEADLEREVPTAVAAAADPYAALRIRDYRVYALGWVLGVIGQQIQSVAVGWEVYRRTGQPLALGIVGGIQALPVLLLALPAGQLADMFDRRKVTIVSLFFSCLCSIGLEACSAFRGPISLMYLLLLLGSISLSLGRPARAAIVPQIVPAAIFSNAATWNSSLFQVASVAGPALGGVVIAFSVPSAYLLDATCTFLFLVTMLFVRAGAPARTQERPGLRSLVAGIQFVWRTRIILAAMALDMFAVLLGGAVYLLPVFAEDILKVGPFGFGCLRAAPAVGAFVMAMALAHMPPMRRAGRNLLWSVAGFGVATIAFGLSKSFWVSLAMLFLTGVLDNISVVIRHTLIQLSTPDRMRGRVSAVNQVFISASNELGGLESGVAAHWFGTVPSVVLGGIGTIVVVGMTALLAPGLRRFGSLQDAKPQED
jgi:MFS family permease